MTKLFEFVEYPFMKNILPGDPDGYDIIPDLTMHSLRLYITDGQSCGDFLGNLLSGNAFKAVIHADDGNARAFEALTKFIARNAPTCCFGSPEIYSMWCALGGLRNYNELLLAHAGSRNDLGPDRIVRLQHVYADAAKRGREADAKYRELVHALGTSKSVVQPVKE